MKRIFLLGICATLTGCAGIKERAYQRGFYDAEQACFENHVRLLNNPGLTKEEARSLIESQHAVTEMRKMSLGLEADHAGK